MMKIKDLNSLRAHLQRLEHKIELDKEKLGGDLKLLKYHLIEDALKAVSGVFKRKADNAE